MTLRYVGAGGNDGSAGTSWATRKLTLGGVEATPVVAGDTVYVGPGSYRETLTVGVSGTAGNPITYIGDVTGLQTDGIGGVVRITGSTNDTTAARTTVITSSSKNYRTFRGFQMDSQSTGAAINATSADHWIVEDCTFQPGTGSVGAILFDGASQSTCTVRRCTFGPTKNNVAGIALSHTATLSNIGHLIENCLFLGTTRGVTSTRVGGVTVRNCTFLGGSISIIILTALAAAQTVTVNNCIFLGTNGTALTGTISGEIVEDYNAFWGNNGDRSNTATGTNSNAFPPLFTLALQQSGFLLPQPVVSSMTEWSQIRAIAGTGEATDDIFGMNRPATSSKKSWGAVQYVDVSRSSTQAHAGTYSLKLADAGRIQLMVPTTAVSTTITCYVYREANYDATATNNPSMVIKQPGQADIIVTDAAASGQWNQLTSGAFTPAALPGYVIVELVSENVATSGSYAVYFDDVAVS